MPNPKVKITLTTSDRVLEACGALVLVVLLTVTLIAYTGLPETLPRHFNFRGQPDAYPSKSFIWFLVALAYVAYVGLSFLTRVPHTLNYGFKVTEENAYRLYQNAVLMIRIIKTTIVFAFSYMVFGTIQIATGKAEDLGTFSLSITVILILEQ